MYTGNIEARRFSFNDPFLKRTNCILQELLIDTFLDSISGWIVLVLSLEINTKKVKLTIMKF